MPDTIAPNLDAGVYTPLKAFIIAAVGLTNAQVIKGYPNRAAMPPVVPGFIAMSAMLSHRLRTNVDTWDQTNPAPTIITSEQGIRLRVQLDCYGTASNDWATILSTLLRDEVGCTALAPTCQPLYTEDPRRAPLTDAEDQYEDKWIVDAQIQYNPVVSVPMQFADTLSVTLINVDERYPP